MNLVVQRYNNFLNYAIAGVFLAEKTVGAEFVSPYMIIMKGQTMKNVWKTFGTLVVVIAVSAATTIAVLRYSNSLQPSLTVSNSETPVIPAAYGRFASLPQAGETDFTNREGGTGVISNSAGMAE